MADETDAGKGENETEESADEAAGEESADEAAGEESADEAAGEEGQDLGEDEETEEGAEEEAPAGGKKKLIVIAAVILAVLGGGGGGAYFMGFFDAFFAEEEKKTVAVIDLAKPVLHEFPVLKADMKTGKCKSPLMKTVLVVQLDNNDLKRLKSMELRIMDQLTQYFRDLERQEMEGKKGAVKLRFDATRIINTLMAPSKIHAIMFKEFILQ